MLNNKIELYPDDGCIIRFFWFESNQGGAMLQVKSVIPKYINAQGLPGAS